jgi:sugar phosphate isomerase/epimerase
MPLIGLSTTSLYPSSLETVFRISQEIGYDGVEIMISSEETRSLHRVKELSRKYNQPVLSIHAPTLLLTHFVWGRDPEQKLLRTAEYAAELGAENVVVHPPYSWQRIYAEDFIGCVREFSQKTGVNIAVENMFPWRFSKLSVSAYQPTWGTIVRECDSLTVDFSHAALSGLDPYAFTVEHHEQVKHIHLCDGNSITGEKDQIFDEHLIPGTGNQPVKETLTFLKEVNWSGLVVAEVSTHKLRTMENKKAALTSTLNYAQEFLL